jgi:hypothetical protein
MFELLGIFAGFLNTEHGANLLQKIGQLLRKLAVSLCDLNKVQQFLVDQVIQSVGKTKASFEVPRGLALRDHFRSN